MDRYTSSRNITYTTRQTTHVTNQPGAHNPFENLDNNWSVELCSCCDNVSRCCYAYWCFCCFMGSLADTIGESKISCCCVPNILTVYRMKIRSMLRIQGDSCEDYCIASCCPLCAALQMYNELESRGITKTDKDHRSDEQPYQKDFF